MNTTIIIKILVLIILLFLSAFFSSTETAMTMANKIRIRSQAQAGDRRCQILLEIYENQSKMLTCILIGNNLVNISASSLTATLAMEIWGSIGVSVTTAVLTLLVLLFGEIAPKSMAAYEPEKLALSYAPLIYFLMWLFTPIIWVVDLLSGAVMKLLRIDTSGKSRLMTEGELRTYVDVGHEEGAIEAVEKVMIHNVFDFSDSAVKDIMIPRIDLTVVSSTTGYDELLDTFRRTMYTRLPVYEDSPENITGIVNIKDLLLTPDEDREKLLAGDLRRDAYYTYEGKKTSDLMEELQRASMTMAFILDEYGSCVGMVTLEDLLEEIVGEIRDEYDEDEEELIQEVSPGKYIIEGTMKLDDINDALSTSIASEDYDSIGGLLTGSLGRLPESGERIITADGSTIIAKEIGKSRVEKVILEI